MSKNIDYLGYHDSYKKNQEQKISESANRHLKGGVQGAPSDLSRISQSQLEIGALIAKTPEVE